MTSLDSFFEFGRFAEVQVLFLRKMYKDDQRVFAALFGRTV